jgi:hypothetical protein
MDIDFETIVGSQFGITFGDSPQIVSGNRALLNRFEIVFMTQTRVMIEGDAVITDNFGGDAFKFIDRPQVLNDIKSISAAIATAVNQTVQSILSDQPNNIPDTEKLQSAVLLGTSVIQGTIFANIQVIPIETQPYVDLMFNLPIIRYEA